MWDDPQCPHGLKIEFEQTLRDNEICDKRRGQILYEFPRIINDLLRRPHELKIYHVWGFFSAVSKLMRFSADPLISWEPNASVHYWVPVVAHVQKPVATNSNEIIKLIHSRTNKTVGLDRRR